MKKFFSKFVNKNRVRSLRDTLEIINYDDEPEFQELHFNSLLPGFSCQTLTFGKHGEVYIIFHKSEKAAFKELSANWPHLEGKIIDSLEEMIIDYDRECHLKVRYFQASLSLVHKDCFHGDDSEIMLSFNLLRAPSWDIWINQTEISHYQPAF